MLKLKAAALAIVIALFASCAKEGPNGAVGPAGPTFYGTISGHVFLYDMYGGEIFANRNKADIYLSNTTIAINPDTTGLYSFQNEPTGTYAVTATDSDFASTVVYDVNFVSGVLNQDIMLSQIPDSFLTAFSVVATTDADSLIIAVAPNAQARKALVFVNNAAASNNAFLLAYPISIPANAASVTFAVPKQELLNIGFTDGALVYYAAYSYVVNDHSVYENTATGTYVYSAINATPLADTARVP